MKPVFLVLLVCLANCCFAQDPEQTYKGKAKEFYIRGEEALLALEYEKAMRLFEKALKINPDLNACYRAIGVCLYGMDRYKEATVQYEKLIQRNPNFSRVLYYDLGLSAYKSGQYHKALDYFKKFSSLQKLDISQFGYNGNKEANLESEYLKKLPDNLLACQSALDQVKYTKNIIIENLGSAINTSGDEYFPFLTNSRQTLYYTSKKNNLADEDLFVSSYKVNTWEEGLAIQDSFNTDFNEGMSTLTHDGRQMYFTSCGFVEKKIDCDIRTAKLKEQSIVSTSNIKGYLNTRKWESQASISCDGNTLYFSSNREGGYGGTDIWYSQKMNDGSWSDPKNVGNGINTKLDEEAPFISRDGSTLYFSSTGHLGLGEQDIFFSKRNKNNKWSQAINLGAPINSAYRELGFFVSADGSNGFFSSNRDDGFGGMDIYKFDLTENLITNPITYVEGFVKDAISNDAIQTVLNANSKTPISTDENGRFFICLEAETVFDILVKAEGYKVYTDTEDIPMWNNKEFYTLEIFLEPIVEPVDPPIEVKPTELTVVKKLVSKPLTPEFLKQSVYFNFDDHNLSIEAKQKLDELIKKIVDQNIQSIELHGYCDYSGSEKYNKELSERRIKSVLNYFSSREINIEKIISMGHGELPASTSIDLDRRVDIILNY